MTVVQSFLRNPFGSMPKVLFLLLLLASGTCLPLIMSRATDPSPGSTGFVAPAMDGSASSSTLIQPRAFAPRVLEPRPTVPTLAEMMAKDANNIAFYPIYARKRAVDEPACPEVIAGPDASIGGEFYLDFPKGTLQSRYTVTWKETLTAMPWGGDKPAVGTVGWYGGVTASVQDGTPQFRRETCKFSGTGFSSGHWFVMATATLTKPGSPTITKYAYAEFIVCSVKLTAEGEPPEYRLPFNNLAGPRRKITMSCVPADLPETLPTPFCLILMPVASNDLPTFNSATTGLRLWSTSAGETGEMPWTMWPGSFVLDLPALDPYWYEGKDYSDIKCKAFSVTGTDLENDRFLDLNGTTMTGLFFGVINQADYEAYFAYEYISGGTAGFVVYDGHNFPLDELDMVVGSVPDERDVSPPGKNEENPGAFIPLNDGYEKNITNAGGQPVVDWMMEISTGIRGLPPIDPEMKKLELKWWKNGDVPLKGKVRFDGSVAHLASNGDVVPGQVMVWYYNPLVILESLPKIPFWSLVLLKEGEYVDIPQDTPESFQPFYIEGLLGGTTPLQVSFITADAPEVFVPLTDTANLTVLAVDLDIDSDNNNGIGIPDQNAAEDEIESIEGLLGKIIRVNDEFSCQYTYFSGKVPGWASGIDKIYSSKPDLLYGGTDFESVNNKNVNDFPAFVPIVVTLPQGITVGNAKLRFIYAESDPNDIERNVDLTRNPAAWKYPAEVSYTLPPGSLRIWTKGGAGRDPGYVNDDLYAKGDFVPSDSDIPATSLGFSDTVRTVILYVEAVRPSNALGDLSISLNIDFNSDAGVILSDRVRFTAMKLEFYQHPTKNQYGFDKTDKGVVDVKFLVRANQDIAHYNPLDEEDKSEPAIADEDVPFVNARQVSVAYDPAAKHSNKTTVEVKCEPNDLLLMQEIRFSSISNAISVSSSAIKISLEGSPGLGFRDVWELEIIGNGNYDVKDNCAVYAYARNDPSVEENRYRFNELSVYAFKEKNVAYKYFMIEDNRQNYTNGQARNTKITGKEFTLSETTENSNIIKLVPSPGCQDVFQVGENLYSSTGVIIGKVIGCSILNLEDGTLQTILTLDRNITISEGTIIHNYSLSANKLINSKEIDDVLRQAVVTFGLSLYNEIPLDIAYDFINEDSSLEIPENGNGEELNRIFAELSELGIGEINQHSKVVIIVRSLHVVQSPLAHGLSLESGGAIIMPSNGNENEFSHEVLHALSLEHNADDYSNVMYYKSDWRKNLDNTPWRASKNNNILLLDNAKQKIQRQWSDITPR